MVVGKHAYLITAHNNYSQLSILISLLDHSNNDIFIHIDKKSKLFNVDDLVVKYSKLFFTERIDVNWGGESQIAATLLLLELATTTDHYAYYHFISGSDLPLKQQSEIHEFFKESNKEMIVGHEVKDEFTINRVKYYHHYADRIGSKGRNSPFYLLEENSLSIQKKTNVNRCLISGYTYFKGVNWFDITDELARYILTKKTEIKEFFYQGECADEFFVQTLIMNSYFSTRFDNTPIRYIPWTHPSAHPNIIKSKDLSVAINSGFLFARKFDENIDYNVIKQIEAYIKTGNYELPNEYQQIVDLQQYLDFIFKSNHAVVLISHNPASNPKLLKYDELVDTLLGSNSYCIIKDLEPIEPSEHISVFIKPYKSMTDAGLASVCIDNVYYYQDTFGLHIYVINDDGQIVDSVSFGGPDYPKDLLRRPRVYRTDNVESVAISDSKLVSLDENVTDSHEICENLLKIASRDLFYDIALEKAKKLAKTTSIGCYTVYKILSIKKPFEEESLGYLQKAAREIPDAAVDLYDKNHQKTNWDQLLINLHRYAYLGDSISMIRLGRAYRDGNHVVRDPERAIDFFRLASKTDQWILIELFDILWHMNTLESEIDAVRTIKPYADSGNKPAIQRLVYAYRTGKEGVKDLYLAADYCRKLSSSGDINSSNDLFDILWAIGTPESYSEMVKLIEPLAVSNGESSIRLGRALRDGKGIGRNLSSAMECMQRALGLGVDWAEGEIRVILELMNEKK